MSTNNTHPPIIAHQGKRFKLFQSHGFLGYVPMNEPDIPDKEPFLQWRGPKFTWEMWSQMLAFFEWSYQEHKSEVQVRLYLNSEAGRWAVWAYPQTPNGMTTTERGDSPDYATQRAQFPDPWQLLGTVHHHCSAAAFQSSVDTQNERNQDGVHLTVGKIGSDEYDLHGRVVLRGAQYNIEWSEWFSVPENARTFPAKLQTTVLNYFLRCPPPPGTPFPEIWKTNCVKPVVQTYGMHNHQWSNSHNTTETSVDTDLRGQFTDPEISFMRAAAAFMSTCRMSHTTVDRMLNESRPVSPSEVATVARVYELANKDGIPAARVDELFDKWHFEIVIEELDRMAKVAEEAARKVIPLPEHVGAS